MPVFFDPILPDGTKLHRGVPRSLWALAALGAGFVVARHTDLLPSAAAFGIAALLCAIAGVGRGPVGKAALTLATACFGMGWFTARLEEPRPGSIWRHGAGSMIATVEGVVLERARELPVERDAMTPPIGDQRVRTTMRVQTLLTEAGPRPVRGMVRVHAGGTAGEAPPAGARVRVVGELREVPAPMNPGEPDRRLWAAQEGIVGVLRVPTLASAEALPAGGFVAGLEARWLRGRAWLESRTRGLLLGDGGEDRGRALLAALILGEESPVLRETRAAFTRLGLVHVLTISGFHIAVMTAVGLLALRLAGDLGRWEPILAGALIALYLTILPFNAPVWRSGLMVLALLLGDALGRRYDRLAILGWIAVALALWRPMDVWSMGFQLSFGLVAVLIRLGEPFHARLFGQRILGPRPTEPTFARSIANAAARLVSTNVLCWTAATPIVMYHTGLVSPWAVLTGVFIVPLVSTVLIAGYVVVLAGALVPPMTEGAAALLARGAEGVAWLVERLDDAPWTSFWVPPVSLAWALAATGVAFYWLARGHRRDWAGLGAAAAAGVWLAIELWLGPALPRSVAVRIDTLAVGDGTCHLIRRGREAVLWDCGSLTPGVGQRIVVRAVRALGVGRVGTVVISHPNLDHFNGLLDLAGPLGVREVVVNDEFVADAARRPYGAEAYIDRELRARGIAVRKAGAGQGVALGDLPITFVAPPADAAWAIGNDSSLVGAIATPTSPPRHILLTGDIQDRAIEHLRTLGPRADILELPHHGSPREASVALVRALNPVVVLQSTGPSRAADARWDGLRSGRAWLCTAIDGASRAEVLTDGTIRAGPVPR